MEKKSLKVHPVNYLYVSKGSALSPLHYTQIVGLMMEYLFNHAIWRNLTIVFCTNIDDRNYSERKPFLA